MSGGRSTRKKAPAAPHPARESAIKKAPTGIVGFDELTQGGLPRNRTTLIVGGAGSGKTNFALQALVHGAQSGEAALFVAFEEPSTQIRENARSLGWDLEALSDRLFFLDAKLPREAVYGGAFDLAGLLSSLDALVAARKVKRVVFDGVDILLGLLESTALERRELHRLSDWAMGAGITCLLTAKTAGTDSTLPERYPFLPFMADCVLHLNQQLSTHTARRYVRVLKYRGTAHSANQHPLVISSRGLEVLDAEGNEMRHQIFTDRVSTGIERLDAMLQGGYHRGSSVLISGAPGAAKTLFAASFAAAACERGEQALYISFDEAPSQIARNVRSVGIDLQQHVDSGRLRMHSIYTRTHDIDQHVTRIGELMRAMQTKHMVIDPISRLSAPGAIGPEGEDAAIRLLDLSKRLGVTVVSTALLATAGALQEATAIGISALSDTWLHLTYGVQAGERNRAITIVKSRGTNHSNQVREVLLSDRGIDLADVYAAGGEVLMGTLRWEREAELLRRAEELAAESARKQSQLEMSIDDTALRIRALERELSTSRVELEHMQGQERKKVETSAEHVKGIKALRRGDAPPASRRRK